MKTWSHPQIWTQNIIAQVWWTYHQQIEQIQVRHEWFWHSKMGYWRAIKNEYLDLNIGIESRMFTFKTYQKRINLYQYITANSAHPPGMIQGAVHSQLLQSFKQNSRRTYYWKSMSFYRKLKARGWSKILLAPSQIWTENKRRTSKSKRSAHFASQISSQQHSSKANTQLVSLPLRRYIRYACWGQIYNRSLPSAA